MCVWEVDAGIKNKFVSAWLDREVDIAIANVKYENENSVTRSKKLNLSEFIKKVDVPGKAICTLCNCLISYGGRSAALILEHCKGKKNVEKVKSKATNNSLDYLLTNGSVQAVIKPFYERFICVSEHSS